MWDGLLPDGVRISWGDPRGGAPALLPAEELLVAGAVPKRRREFAHGRAHARRLLAELGVEGFALLAGARREPLWPEGIVGSISHTEAVCGAAVAAASRYPGLGIDAEPDEPLEPELAKQVCRADELARLAGARFLEPGIGARLVFSAKESVYKCLYPVTHRALQFSEVAIAPGPDGKLEVELDVELPELGGATPAGRWARRGGFLLTAVWMARAGV